MSPSRRFPARICSKWPGSGGRSIRTDRPDLEPALALQQELLTRTVELADAIAGGRLPQAVAAAEIRRRQTQARRAGAGRRADPAAGGGAHAGDVPALRRAGRAAAPARRRPTSAQSMEGGKLEAALAADRVAAPRSGGAAHRRRPSRPVAGSDVAGRRARGQPVRARAAADAVRHAAARELRDALDAWPTATARRADRGRRSARSPAAIARCAVRSARARGS